MEAPISAGVGLATIGTAVKRPQLPNNFFKFPVGPRLKAVQQFISSFEYRMGPQPHFNSNKFRPLARIMDTAKLIIYNPQPVKCVEAVFLAIYLTSGMFNVERIPVGFETETEDKVCQHIVLVVRNGKKFGAFGSSREPELMSREFEFESLSSIVGDYKRAYEGRLKHAVSKIWIGLPVEHNNESYNLVCWRYLTLEPATQSWKECCAEMDKLTSQSKRLWERWLLDGQGEIVKSSIGNCSSFPKAVVKRPPSRCSRPPSRTTNAPSEKNVIVSFCDIPSVKYLPPADD